MFSDIDKMLKLLPTLTKEEADFIEQICGWSDVERRAFMLAKRLFEEKNEC
jgi:hypothetical protein